MKKTTICIEKAIQQIMRRQYADALNTLEPLATNAIAPFLPIAALQAMEYWGDNEQKRIKAVLNLENAKRKLQ